MKTLEDRIEAAEEAYNASWRISEEERRREAYKAFAGELFAGTHWLAPMEATDEMCSAVRYDEAAWFGGPDGAWAVFRDAYLNPEKAET